MIKENKKQQNYVEDIIFEKLSELSNMYKFI